jgi:hypothetical protein
MTRNTTFFAAAVATAFLTFSVAIASAATTGHSGANGAPGGPSGPGPSGPSATSGHGTTPLYTTAGCMVQTTGRTPTSHCVAGGA